MSTDPSVTPTGPFTVSLAAITRLPEVKALTGGRVVVTPESWSSQSWKRSRQTDPAPETRSGGVATAVTARRAWGLSESCFVGTVPCANAVLALSSSAEASLVGIGLSSTAAGAGGEGPQARVRTGDRAEHREAGEGEAHGAVLSHGVEGLFAEQVHDHPSHSSDENLTQPVERHVGCEENQVRLGEERNGDSPQNDGDRGGRDYGGFSRPAGGREQVREQIFSRKRAR